MRDGDGDGDVLRLAGGRVLAMCVDEGRVWAWDRWNL